MAGVASILSATYPFASQMTSLSMNRVFAPHAGSLLILLVCVAPWANGGADPITQAALFVSGAGVALAMAVWSWSQRPAAAAILAWPAVAVGLAIALCGLYRVPVWATNSAGWAPATVQLKRALMVAPEGGGSGGERSSNALLAADTAEVPRRTSLTLDPHATNHTAAMQVLMLTLFVAASWWLGQRHQLRRLAVGIATSGAALSLFAVIAKATWNDKLYWCIPIGHPQGVFGPIIYHNQAGGLLLMTLASAVYLLLEASVAPRHFRPLAAGAGKESQDLRLESAATWRCWLNPWPLLVLALLVLNAAGLLLTLSRGAMLSAVIATVLTVLIMQPRSSRRGLVVAAIIAVLGAGGSLFYFRMSEAVGKRYATLFESQQLLGNSRLEHWQEGMQAGWDYGLFGVGSGAYHHVPPLYQEAEVQRTFLRAHNQYLETWVDSGIPGLLLLTFVLLTTGRVLMSLTRRRRSRWRHVAAWGWLVLLAAVLHAVVDYVLYLPANGMMLAVVLGAIWGVAWQAYVDREALGQAKQVPRQTRFGWCLQPRHVRFAALALVLANGWTAWAGYRWYVEDTAVRAIPWGADQASIPPKRLAASIEKLQQLAPETDDYRVPLTLGELQIVRFRQQAATQLARENGLEPEAAIGLWAWTDPVVFLQRAHALEASGQSEQVDLEIRSEPLIQESLGAARKSLLHARQLAPAVAQIHLRLAELSFLEPPLEAVVTHLRRAEKVSPGSTDAQYEIGRRYLAAGRRDAGLQAWRRSLALDIRHWDKIYDVAGKQLSPQEINRDVLPDNPELLALVAARQYTEPEQVAARERLLDRVMRLLESPAEGADGQARRFELAGEVCLLREDRQGAIDAFAKALRYQPQNHELRARRAALLLRAGRLDEARSDAKYAARLQPRNDQYRSLIKAIADAIAVAGREAPDPRRTAPAG